MKQIFAAAALFSLAALVGCDSGHTGPTNKVGGPGVSNLSTADHGGSITDAVTGGKDNTFKLSASGTDLKQGDEKSIDIGIKRGHGFDQDVTLSFSNEDNKDLPKGLSFDPAKPVIKKGDEKTSVKVKATDDAAINKFTIKVTGKPATGDAAAADITIEVKKKS